MKLMTIGMATAILMFGIPEGANAGQNPFEFSFYSITIKNTRSRHEDTDYAFLSLKVGNTQYPTIGKKIGDLNNGDHPIGLVFTGIQLRDDQTPVTIKWSVINSGHGANQQYQNAFNTAGPVVINQTTDGGLAEILKSVFSLGSSLLFANCDGVVVSDQWVGTAHQLYQFMASRNNVPQYWTWDSPTVVRYILHDPGTDSDHGCGSNSDYYSGIRITKH